jgi:hypothetical protein
LQLDDFMSEGRANEPEPGRKDWLDIVAPVQKKAIREAAGGMFLLAVVAVGGGVWMSLTQPFWEMARRLPLPLGIVAILAIVTGIWFALVGVNVLRRTRKDGR